MAGNFNKVFLLGNLTRDVELKYTPSNQPVASIGIATNRRYRTRDGEDREETTFVDCEAWGRTAEMMNQYLAKGRPVFIEGRLKFEEWEDKEGKKRSKLRVVVENFQFIDSRGGGGTGGAGGSGGSGGASRGGGRDESPAPVGGGHEPVGEEEIPF